MESVSGKCIPQHEGLTIYHTRLIVCYRGKRNPNPTKGSAALRLLNVQGIRWKATDIGIL
jgi:hypothetical protein